MSSVSLAVSGVKTSHSPKTCRTTSTERSSSTSPPKSHGAPRRRGGFGPTVSFAPSPMPRKSAPEFTTRARPRAFGSHSKKRSSKRPSLGYIGADSFRLLPRGRVYARHLLQQGRTPAQRVAAGRLHRRALRAFDGAVPRRRVHAGAATAGGELQAALRGGRPWVHLAVGADLRPGRARGLGVRARPRRPAVAGPGLGAPPRLAARRDLRARRRRRGGVRGGGGRRTRGRLPLPLQRGGGRLRLRAHARLFRPRLPARRGGRGDDLPRLPLADAHALVAYRARAPLQLDNVRARAPR